MRVSRPCYDKPHRCPGWAGGGAFYGRADRCISGRISVDYEARLWQWRMWRCTACDVITLPYVVRWVDVTVPIRRAWARLRYEWHPGHPFNPWWDKARRKP